MTDPDNPDLPASPPKDYYSELVKWIGEVKKDPALLRDLVYSMARHKLKPEAALSHPETQSQRANIIPVLEQALELERAIERVEADSAQQPRPGAEQNQNEGGTPEHANPMQGDEASSHERPFTDNVLVPLSDDPGAWPERRNRTFLTRAPTWLDPNIRVSLDAVDYVRVEPPQVRDNLFSALKLVVASIIGVVLYVGISGWIYMTRQSVYGPTERATQAGAPTTKEPAGAAQMQQPPLEPQPILPFPLPKSYGVYAGVGGHLVSLEPLTVKVPTPRVLISAEITQPSKTTVSGDKLAFVVFRRDLLNSAPQNVAVRVVARVAHTMRFVNGKPTVVPIRDSWRIRDKSYEFQVSPIETNREMIVIQPDPEFVFPAGRYALVLNGTGYDFTVAGPINSPDQCLEQVEAVNGTIVSECPKS